MVGAGAPDEIVPALFCSRVPFRPVAPLVPLLGLVLDEVDRAGLAAPFVDELPPLFCCIVVVVFVLADRRLPDDDLEFVCCAATVPVMNRLIMKLAIIVFIDAEGCVILT